MATEDEKKAIIDSIKSIHDNVYHGISHLSKGKLLRMVNYPTTIDELDKQRLTQTNISLQKSRKELEAGENKQYSAADLDKLQKNIRIFRIKNINIKRRKKKIEKARSKKYFNKKKI